MLLQILLTIFIIIEIHVWSRMIWLSCEIFCNWMIEDHRVLFIDIWESERIYACRYIDYLIDRTYDKAYRWRKKWKNE